MDKYDFVPPAPTMFTLADHEGHAAIFTPTTYLTDITTKFGVRDAIVLDVVCLDCGEEFHDVRMFQSRIIGTLKQLIGRKVLARIAQGTPTKPGQRAPWTLIDATRDSAVVKAATVWLDARLDDPRPVSHTTYPHNTTTTPAHPAAPVPVQVTGYPQPAAPTADTGTVIPMPGMPTTGGYPAPSPTAVGNVNGSHPQNPFTDHPPF